MKTLDRYIIKKFLGTFFYAILLIISISIIFDYAEKIDDFMEREAPWGAVIFDYYLNFAPYFANLFSHLFTFIAVIFFTSKMTSNSEVIAILTSGISFNRFLRPYFISATIIAVFTFLLNCYIIPPANSVRLDFEEQYHKNVFKYRGRDIHKQLEPGVFVYIQSYNNKTNVGNKFSMEKIVDGKLVSKLTSDYVKWDSIKNSWNIHNYFVRNIDGIAETIKKGKSLDTIINMYPEEFNRRQNVIETMNIHELNKFIEQEELRGTENIEYYLIDKYRRLSSPFAIFILTIIGVSLSVRKNRGGVGGHLGVGLLLSFSYIMFMQVSHQFSLSGAVSPLLAVWIPNFIFLVIAAILYRLAPK